MLFIKHINLTQFKNYTSGQFSFTEKITGICGSNGAGKTNILDGVYYACFTKSYFNSTESQNVQFGKDGLRVECHFDLNNQPQKVVGIYRGKKEFLVNDVPVIKLAEHIGQYPCVIIAPDDTELVTGSSDLRRRFLDTLISQVDREYLYSLISYNKILQQRNSHLKQLNETGSADFSLLEVLDKQLVQPGNYIFSVRSKLCLELLKTAEELYKTISGNMEKVELKYNSQLNETAFAGLLFQSRSKDLVLQRSTAGIHRDDLGQQLNGADFKTAASQGQKKSLLFALKLAEFELLKKEKGFAPILLLDDVFEKLDEQRMHQLLYRVCSENDGQVIITDTHCQRLEEALNELKTGYSIINLNKTNG